MSPPPTGDATKPVRVFLSWSGESSRLVAKALCDGMRQLSDRLEPWLAEDLEPGAEWASTLVPQIKKARLAVLCLTKRNAGAAWIAFETGAYYGSPLRKGVVPYLLDIQPGELAFPLALFQSVTADWRGTKSLFTRIGELVELDATAVEERFTSTIWPQLNDQLTVIQKLQAEAQATAGSPANIANAFFLGHDLRWTMNVLTSGAPPDDVKHGIVQILHQATDLGIGQENAVLALRHRMDELLASPDEAWTAELRAEVDLALRLAFERISAIITSLQPEYRPYDPANHARWLEMQAKGRA